MRPFVPALVFAAAAGIAASPAEAQSLAQPRTWTVTPFLNTSLGIDVPGPEALETVLDNSLGLGVAVGYDLTHNLGFEGEIAYLFDAAGDTHDIDWSVSNFSANAVYHFDVKRITPYATFGLGVERSSFDDQDTNRLDLDLDPSATEVSINFGGGVKYPINTRWVARGDIRRFQANDIAPDYWRLYGGISWVVRR
ncbi:MAG: outer membrane protein [Vicinamibacterales bacterium]